MHRSRVLGVGLVGILFLGVLPGGGVLAAPAPVIAIGDVTLPEPAGRNTTATVELPVTLSQSTSQGVEFAWRTVPGTAGSADFVAASGVASIPAGSNGTRIPIEVRTDKLTESEETFSVELTSSSVGTIVDAVGQITIRDTVPGFTIGDVVVYEPDDGAIEVSVAVTLSTTAKRAVNYSWVISPGTGDVGSDIVGGSGSGTIAQGSLSALIHVTVLGDTAPEPEEITYVDITFVQNAELGDSVGAVWIRDNDVAPPPTPTPTPVPTPTPAPTATPPATPTPSPTADAFGWQPPAGAVPAAGTVLYIESSPGDYIGQGQTYLYTKANSLLTVSSGAGRVDFSVRGDERWNGTVAEDRTTVETGYWEGVGRFPFYTPGVTFTGEGRGCNTVLGRFSVDEVTFSSGVLQTVTLRFEQRCEVTGPPLLGFLRYDVADPTTPPPPGDPADFPWSPPAGAVPAEGSYLYFESSPGDYIGGGRTDLYTPATSAFTVTESSGHIHLSIVRGSYESWWYGEWSGPDAQTQLVVGLYDNLQRYPFHNPVEGGLSFYGEGRGCNELAGAFALDEIAYDTSGLASVTLRFVQRCEFTGPPLYGSLRWDRP